MFTGIIIDIGKIVELNNDKLVVKFDNPQFSNLELGTSIAIDGCCLTLSDYKNNNLVFQVSEETFSRTALNKNHCGYVNLELPSTLNSFLSGHIVQGHVDSTIKITNIAELENGMWTFKFKDAASKYIVDKGSITGFYTVLVEGDDANDPIADAIRAIVDGHIYLSRDIAEKGLFPAIDLLASTSRVMVDVADQKHLDLNLIMRRTLATYREAEDLINIGAYVQGSNPEIDYAITKNPLIQEFIQQGMNEQTPLNECIERLQQILGDSLEEKAVEDNIT